MTNFELFLNIGCICAALGNIYEITKSSMDGFFKASCIISMAILIVMLAAEISPRWKNVYQFPALSATIKRNVNFAAIWRAIKKWKKKFDKKEDQD